jgi:sugar O-acyltransferase (sialic acid O-acetyltransferase NeuD family)
MKAKLYIVGAGSVGGHIAHNIDGYGNKYKIAGLFDDDPDKIGDEMFGYPVIGSTEDALELEDAHVAVGIAFPKVKEVVIQKLSENETLIFPSLVHEKAWVSKDVSIGKGSVIYPGSSINYGSDIGEFVVMNMNCALGHHTKVGHFSSLAPSVSSGGHTSIGDCVDVGIGACTIQNIEIGKGCIIGGQSMVINSVPSGATVAGVPSKQINS